MQTTRRVITLLLVVTLFFVQATLAASSKKRITTVPLLSGSATIPELYSGYLLARQSMDAHLFYFFVPSENKSPNDPVVVWLNGGILQTIFFKIFLQGPGCTSLVGFFFENGPFVLRDPNTVVVNPYSWHKAANMLFIDQPIGFVLKNVLIFF